MTSLPSMTVVEALGGAPEIVSRLLGPRVLERCLQAAGLPDNPVMDFGNYVPEITINRFFDAAARKAGDDLFGLQFTRSLSVRDYGVWGEYVLQAKDLDAALRRAADVIHLHADKDQLRIRRGPVSTFFEYSFAEKSGPGYRQTALAALGPLISIPQHFCGQYWQPMSVALDLNDRLIAGDIEAHLNLKTRSDESCISIEIPNADLIAANPKIPDRITTREDVERACLGGPPQKLVPFVEYLILQKLGTEAISLDAIAHTMATSRRSLQRGFERSGTDFRSVVIATKMRRAQELLRRQTETVSEIATQLDYATTSHFARAFRKSLGVSPNDYRNELMR